MLRTNPDFRRLWTGGTVSALGSWLLVVAVPAQAYRLTHSVVATGLTVALESLPALLIGPVTGVFADRWNRRRTMIAADLVCAGVVAAMAFADRPGRVGLLYAAVLVENLAVVCFRPAARAALPLVVGAGRGNQPIGRPLAADLATANGLVAFAAGAVRLVAPPLGALLLTTGGLAAIVAVDVVSYLVSAAATARITVPLGPGERTTRGGAIADLRAGLRYLVAAPPLRGALLAGFVFLTANGGLTALTVPFVVERLTGDGADFGYLVTGLGVGYLAGAALTPRLIARLPTRVLLAGAQVATGLGFLALFNARGLPFAIAAAAAVGLPGSVYLVTVAHLVQAVTANPLLGRVGAVFFAGDAAAAVAGAALGPVLATAFGLATGLNVLGVATVLTAVSAAYVPATGPPPGAAGG